MIALMLFCAAPPLGPLPPGAIARFGDSRFRHGGWVLAAAYSPDGRMLVSAGRAGLRLWDARTGKLLRRIGEADRYDRAFAFSPDSRRIALAGFDSVKLLDVDTGECLREFKGHEDVVCSVAWSPEGKLVASGATDGTVLLWDPDTGKQRHRLKGHAADPWTIAFRADGGMLVTTDHKGTVQAWHPSTGKRLWRAEDMGDIRGVAFHGMRLATASDAGVRVWDSAKGTSEEVREGSAFAVSYSPSGKLAIAWEDGTAEIVGRRRWRTSPTAASGIAWSPDGKELATVAKFRSRIDRWDATTGKLLEGGAAHAAEAERLRVLPGGKELASSSAMGDLLHWPLVGGAPHAVPLPIPPHIFRAPEPSPDGALVAVPQAGHGSIALCDARTGRPLRRLAGAWTMQRLDFSPDRKRLAVWHADGLAVREVRTGRLAAKHAEELTASPVALRYSSDGTRLLATKEDGEAILHDPATAKVLLRRRIAERVHAADLSPDGRLAAFRADSHLVLWDTVADRIGSAWRHGLRTSSALAFSPDGRLLATGGGAGDGRVLVWEVATGRIAASFIGHESGVSALTWTPDARALLTAGGDTTILMWDTAGRRTARFDGERLWRELAERDGAAAVRDLATPAGAAMIGRKMRPVPNVDARRVGELLAKPKPD
ncbi:MAG: WD40 repeat domain-containing protein [Gemmataceae bacterium]|nr:WD40 repeat domain-containing protein [Gemmataceae bacterium]